MENNNLIECRSCNGKEGGCDVCNYTGFVDKDAKWSFSCDCGAQTVEADCPENAYIPHCECMDD